MSFATRLLSSGGYCIYNRFLAKNIGLEGAILLGALCDLVDGYGNGFYCQQDRLAEKTMLTEYAIRSATQKLSEMKFVDVERKGLPAKLFYTVNEGEIARFFQFFENDTTSSSTPSSSSKSQNKTISNSLINTVSTVIPLESTSSEVVPRKKFVVPTVEEVAAYCTERGNGIDAQGFVDFYASKGWRVGNTPMKDWKAAVRTWEKRERGETNADNRRGDERSAGRPATGDTGANEIDPAELDRLRAVYRPLPQMP